MATLHSFQNEMDEIAAKQRTDANDKGKAKADSAPTDDSDEREIEETIMKALLSNADQARDLVASLITRHVGEYVFRIGLQPPRAQLFDNELTDDVGGWTGIARTEAEVDELKEKITAVVEEVGGKSSVLFKASMPTPRVSLLLRLPPLSVAQTPEVRCCVVGNVDAGKSSFLGVLTRGGLDDGRGRARVALFRHKHEIESGRTSSIGMEILGFGPSGSPILPTTAHSNEVDVIRREKLGWEEISIQAAKIVSFSDLAGHERYLKTTLYGLTSGAPSCVILIVGGNAGLIGMSKEHLAIALALGVPIVVCITKIDMTPPQVLAETIKQVTKILKSPGCRKTPVFVKSMETAVEISAAFGKNKLCPIFLVSNVTGEGLDFVRCFLNLLPPSDHDDKFRADEPLEYVVTEIWSVPYARSSMARHPRFKLPPIKLPPGIVNSGVVKTGDAILFGPDSNGNFQTTSVRSMQRKRADITRAEAGQCVSLALKRVRKNAIRKGMVIVHKDAQPKAVRRFEGQVLILYHNTTLQKGYQAMLHCGAVRQTVRIVEMDAEHLRTGDRARVTFEFLSHPDTRLRAITPEKDGCELTLSLLMAASSSVPASRACSPRSARTSLLPASPPMYRRQASWASSSFNSESPYPPSASPLLQARYSLHPIPQQWGNISLDQIDPDEDDLNNFDKPNHDVEFGGSPWSLRGITNLGCLFLLVACILALFIGYPVISYRQDELATNALGNLRNATGQLPTIEGWGLIDSETPENSYTMPSWVTGEEMQLVFSDEFNTDGRTFYPGDDPYWEAVDLHYWATNNLEWYDPAAIITANGSLVITLSEKQTHGLNYQGGMLTTWNKFCFTGGYIEANVRLPGLNNVQGLWPSCWLLGNLGRAGYGATLDGLWPYSYDSCDVGTAPNQTYNGAPFAATVNGDHGHNDELSWLPGQRLSACTCADQDDLHPGPKRGNGYVGRAAPEIDVFEAQITSINKNLVPQVSQSAQFAPFDAAYEWDNTSDVFSLGDPSISARNTFFGSILQEAASILTNTNPNCYEGNGTCFAAYGFEYKPGFDEGYITWIATSQVAWTLKGGAVAANPLTEIGPRQIPVEPMYIIANLGMSYNFGAINLPEIPFPVHLEIDYIRVYQPKNAINIGCDPPDFPTNDFINTYIEAYTNPNYTTWREDFGQPYPNSSFLGQC
uniref:Glycoside hydrolase family 16 protein n=1 Tax=Mycena chlorophos TaxID=658473 RepID=A0ABQ0LZ17_MYCCL|nr:predicted protein [Mycena chlorophos]